MSDLLLCEYKGEYFAAKACTKICEHLLYRFDVVENPRALARMLRMHPRGFVRIVGSDVFKLRVITRL